MLTKQSVILGNFLLFSGDIWYNYKTKVVQYRLVITIILYCLQYGARPFQEVYYLLISCIDVICWLKRIKSEKRDADAYQLYQG